MSHHDIRSAVRPEPDQPMVDIADYVVDYKIDSKEAYDTARYMLMDSLGCSMLAMKFPEMVKHLGPLVPRLPLAQLVAEGHDALLRARPLLVAPGAAERSVEAVLGDRVEQGRGLQPVA